MTKSFVTEISVLVHPIYHQDPPQVHWGLDGIQHHSATVTEPMWLDVSAVLDTGAYRFYIDFVNKQDGDCVPDQGLDKAIEIREFRFHGFAMQKFLWAGVYTPIYPQPWLSQQDPPPPDQHASATYLGWNGRWHLDFECPVFPWIHRTNNMGWVWPVVPTP